MEVLIRPKKLLLDALFDHWAEGSPELRLEVNTAYWRAYELLRGRGYRVATPLVRMTRGRSPDGATDHLLVDNWR